MSKPYGFPGCARICLAVQRNNGSSTLNGLARNGARNKTVAITSVHAGCAATQRLKFANIPDSLAEIDPGQNIFRSQKNSPPPKLLRMLEQIIILDFGSQ